MLNLIKVEFYKLKTSKLFYFIIFVNLLQAVVIYIFSDNLRVMNGKKSLAFIFNMQSSLALIILIGIFASDYIVTEFTSGCIKNIIAYGHKRISIFTAKSIAYYVGIVIISSIPPLLMTGINTVINGYGEAITVNSLLFVARVYLLMLLVHIAIGSVCVLIAFISRNVSVTMALIVSLDFINRICMAIATQKSGIMLIYDKIIFAQPSIVASNSCTSAEDLQAVIVSIITIFIATTIGGYAFKRADIS
ncbi:ABC transporter permease [Clostridium sp. FP2]|uniref:ABC transporter permease n=1 Tax=Clostridium TaxID=1485 RepID=UPI0013E999D9|nr:MULTISPECIES: ABC transporter permease [Clostridium]MBW9157613.1 ABC transporter permease [Clostridium tagluense]MBZ9622694.1 ABC transporter permease [Clostridium sp. FP2]WLC66977.1 ABC transporter permease [Clostridium tagluense]